MRQKGGAITHNGRTMTAEQILDKFTATYFDKNTIDLEPSFYQTIYPLVDIAKNKEFYKFFDLATGYGLEDSELTYDGINKRVWIGLMDTTRRNGAKAILKFPITPYHIVTAFTPDRKVRTSKPAHEPYIEQQPTVGNAVPSWKVYVKDIHTNNYEYANIEFQAPNIEKAMEKLIMTSDPSYFIQNPEIITEYLDGVWSLNSTIPIGPSFDAMSKSSKIVFIKQGQNIRPIYCEQSTENPSKYYFHPHNLINFLPKTTSEQVFKTVFNQIVEKLNQLSEGGYIYSVDPDKFYHIHLTKIPNETDLLLTIHAAYEDTSIDDKFAKLASYKYEYTNQNGRVQSKNLGRPGFPTEIINTFKSDPRKMTKKETIKKMRRLHNAFILVKRDTNTHSLYKLSSRSQVGNPFLTLYGNFHVQLYNPFSNFPLSQNLLGDNVLNINHISGKGVMLTIKPNECQVFCNHAVNNDIKVKLLTLVFDTTLSNPIQESELLPYKRTLFAYLNTLNRSREPNRTEYTTASAEGATEGSSLTADEVFYTYSLPYMTGGKRKFTRRSKGRVRRTRKQYRKRS
jgi:hypothetical protein